MTSASGNPVADPDGFRRTLGQFATGVVIVTALERGSIFGMAVNSFSSLSLDPPLVQWSIRLGASALAGFRAAGAYNVSILAEDQLGLARKVAKGGPDRFAGIRWTPGENGLPLIDGAIGHLECRIAAEHPAGDHVIFIGEVGRFAVKATGQPLLFAGGVFAASCTHPALGSAVPLHGY